VRNHAEFLAEQRTEFPPPHPLFIPPGANFSAPLLILWASGENGLRIGYFIFVKSGPNEASIEREREGERENYSDD
jgi:hypothetical protein